MSLQMLGANPGFLAIIPPKTEVAWLSDAVASREGPIHSAVMIALVALFIISWVCLTESPKAGSETKGIRQSLPR